MSLRFPVCEALHDVRRSLRLAVTGTDRLGGDRPELSAEDLELLPDTDAYWRSDAWSAFVPACLPECLGDPTFRRDHQLRFNYVCGAMANGIGSAEIVEAMAGAGMIGVFGAAGLELTEVDRNIERLQRRIGPRPQGFNLIHSPGEPAVEEALADLYLRRGVGTVEASAYLDLTLPLVRYRLAGIHATPDGQVVTPHRVIAKASRVEVATRFFSPPPDRLVAELVHRGELTPEQANLARRVPVAQDLTAEADSAGHTDNRPAVTLLPTLIALRDRLQQQHKYTIPLRVGAAGGLATPAALAAAFQMGAAYVLTGSVNQACREAGTSDAVRAMLAEAEQADVIMAPAADMFEMGVKLQVLKRGTMFAMRAARLFELYRTYDRLEDIPPSERANLEKNLFRASLDDIGRQTAEFWRHRDPEQLDRANRDPKHHMALLFRWYLGLSSQWASLGDPNRRMDYQVWCGPAMGAFNEWVRGSFLQDWRNRRVVTVARNLLHGACVLTRIHILRVQGASIPSEWCAYPPRPDGELQSVFD